MRARYKDHNLSFKVIKVTQLQRTINLCQHPLLSTSPSQLVINIKPNVKWTKRMSHKNKSKTRGSSWRPSQSYGGKSHSLPSLTPQLRTDVRLAHIVLSLLSSFSPSPSSPYSTNIPSISTLSIFSLPQSNIRMLMAIQLMTLLGSLLSITLSLKFISIS